jgi:cytochrome c553
LKRLTMADGASLIRPTVFWILLLPGLALANSPDGAALFAHGDDHGVLPCAACHGAGAQGNASIGAPRLAGLPAAVIEQALARIAASPNGNGAMRMVAQSLSPAEKSAVADYLASLK